jgi:hypothetical protein
MFNIHKNLIRRTSAYFFDMYKTEPPAGRRFALNDEDPQVFKLFVEFLYTQRVPAVSTTMSDGARALRTKQLCQLYAFADRFQVQFEIRNRIMDKIQDGFAVLDKFPEPGLVQGMCPGRLSLGFKALLYLNSKLQSRSSSSSSFFFLHPLQLVLCSPRVR